MTIDDKKIAIAIVEKRFGCKLDELKEMTDIIYKHYRNKFSYKGQIYKSYQELEFKNIKSIQKGGYR